MTGYFSPKKTENWRPARVESNLDNIRIHSFHVRLIITKIIVLIRKNDLELGRRKMVQRLYKNISIKLF